MSGTLGKSCTFWYVKLTLMALIHVNDDRSIFPVSSSRRMTDWFDSVEVPDPRAAEPQPSTSGSPPELSSEATRAEVFLT